MMRLLCKRYIEILKILATGVSDILHLCAGYGHHYAFATNQKMISVDVTTFIK